MSEKQQKKEQQPIVEVPEDEAGKMVDKKDEGTKVEEPKNSWWAKAKDKVVEAWKSPTGRIIRRRVRNVLGIGALVYASYKVGQISAEVSDSDEDDDDRNEPVTQAAIEEANENDSVVEE